MISVHAKHKNVLPEQKEQKGSWTSELLQYAGKRTDVNRNLNP